ncbi:transposase [Promineifilum sp.]|uniref:IS701 family transposase n=1 Tax=Promineifilum sp. TaxID=2664178 RepID=UPI0035AE3618
MNRARCDDLDYIQFLIAAQAVFSNTEAARCDPRVGAERPAHDAYTRLLRRQPPDSAALWAEVQGCIALQEGMLVLDDSTLDKPYARAMALVTSHWSGKHRAVVEGINLVSLVWTAGDARYPCDFRLYDKTHDGLSKNDHFRQMVAGAHERGFRPELVAFDSWYASLDNLKAIRGHGWTWLTQLKSNRLVRLDGSGNRPLAETLIGRTGSVVHLKGYGWVQVFKIAVPHGGIEFWATNDLTMRLESLADYVARLWHIEEYHRSLKQFCGVERAQHRSAVAQRNHIGFALRAFLRLEYYRLHSGVSSFEAKARIVREAIRSYLAKPLYTLPSTA